MYVLGERELERLLTAESATPQAEIYLGSLLWLFPYLGLLDKIYDTQSNITQDILILKKIICLSNSNLTGLLYFYLPYLAILHAVEFQFRLVFEVHDSWGRNKGVEVKELSLSASNIRASYVTLDKGFNSSELHLT